MDISFLPEIEQNNQIFFNEKGEEQDFLEIIQENEVNYIRLKLWHDPDYAYASLEAVKGFSQRLRSFGFKIWLTVHYSDTWADPGKQIPPEAWRELLFKSLTDSVYHYTKRVVGEINPEIFQIGNEINSGFLHPMGQYPENAEQFKQLIDTAIFAIRSQNYATRIMLHYAGHSGSKEFFQQFEVSDYDMIGISYYPFWHGNDLQAFEADLFDLASSYEKQVLIAETAYPFTLAWNDLTHNFVGLEEQLVTGYPATHRGQLDFMLELRDILSRVPHAMGFCYWGAEFVAFKGPEAQDGSPWENMAVFDFNNHALEVLKAFQKQPVITPAKKSCCP